MARRKGPQAQQAYDYMKEKIVSFAWAPGFVVSDYLLEQDLAMSRSPIREAMMRLAADGLMENVHGKMQVAALTIEDVIEIWQVRKAVETAAMQIIIERGGLTEEQKIELTDIHTGMRDAPTPAANYHYDDLFHCALMKFAGNGRLIQVFERMRVQISRTRWLNLIIPNRLEEGTREHEAIYQALMCGDPETSLESLSAHLVKSMNNFRLALSTPYLNMHSAMYISATLQNQAEIS